MDLIQKSVVSIGYDVQKLPLGQLDPNTIQRGNLALKEIGKVLNKKAKGDLAQLSSDFYTVIPHNFGMKNMSQFVIRDKKTLK